MKFFICTDISLCFNPLYNTIFKYSKFVNVIFCKIYLIIILGISWTKEEVRLLLKTVQELTSRTKANDSLEDEKLQTLVKVLSEAGYRKTAEQIKHKLALLKNSYLKCNLEDSSEKDIFECPFYNELHGIFHTPVSDERYEFIQNLLSENMDLSTSKFSDHSYTHIKFGNSSGEGRINDKVTVLPNKSLDTWFPVESIMGKLYNIKSQKYYRFK